YKFFIIFKIINNKSSELGMKKANNY
ncbi:hypothetical protein Q604_UNBC04753G0001, partial [human gut metagenome]